MNTKRAIKFLVLLMLLSASATVRGQSANYPKEIRGYKVERAAVEMKGSNTDKSRETAPPADSQATSSGVDQLITFSTPELARVTPLGITFDVPVVVAPVKQSGHVHFLLFEDMTVNGHSVEINDYDHTFDLPNKEPLTLRDTGFFYGG